MIVRLTRHAENEYGTFGFLTVGKSDTIFTTLELPDLNNLRNVSCIPKGAYPLEKRKTGKYKGMYEVLGVEGRSDILFHLGNYKRDTKGCILLGTTFCEIGVLNSKKAVSLFTAALDAEKEQCVLILK